MTDNLRRAFKASGMAKMDIARALDVDSSVVGRWLTGERTPTVQNLMDLAGILGLEMADLWDGPHATPATPEQQAMLQKMAGMTPEQQQALLALAATMTRGG
jgi:transcriptional regulator with XRE-family HTH domain